MINDITSTWQTGNHGNTTLNKHCVPTGAEREKGGDEEEEDVFFSERFIVIVVMS